MYDGFPAVLIWSKMLPHFLNTLQKLNRIGIEGASGLR